MNGSPRLLTWSVLCAIGAYVHAQPYAAVALTYAAGSALLIWDSLEPRRRADG